VSANEIDPMLFSHAYYLVPAKNGEKGYLLLREVMQETEKVAIGKVVLFRKQRLVTIMPRGDYLVLEVMRFAREVLTLDEMASLTPRLKGVKVSPREIDMAEALVQGMSVKWKPEKYHDTYSEDLLKLIAAKARKGGVIEEVEPPAAEEEVPRGKVVDLMPILKKSPRGGNGLKNASPVFWTSATDAVGFLSMNFGDSPPFRDMGNMASIGVMIAFIMTYTVLPGVALLFSDRIEAKPLVLAGLMRKMTGAVLRIHNNAGDACLSGGDLVSWVSVRWGSLDVGV